MSVCVLFLVFVIFILPIVNGWWLLQVNFEQGIQILKIFKDHSSKTCILDDFEFYEARQKIIQEKKAKHQLLQKQVYLAFN